MAALGQWPSSRQRYVFVSLACSLKHDLLLFQQLVRASKGPWSVCLAGKLVFYAFASMQHL